MVLERKGPANMTTSQLMPKLPLRKRPIAPRVRPCRGSPCRTARAAWRNAPGSFPGTRDFAQDRFQNCADATTSESPNRAGQRTPWRIGSGAGAAGRKREESEPKDGEKGWKGK